MFNRVFRVFMLAGALAVAACGSAPIEAPADLKPAGPPPDLFTKMCPSTCTTHAQCQSQCAAAPVGINCCDDLTNTCYVVASTSCPMPPPPDMATAGPY